MLRRLFSSLSSLSLPFRCLLRSLLLSCPLAFLCCRFRCHSLSLSVACRLCPSRRVLAVRVSLAFLGFLFFVFLRIRPLLSCREVRSARRVACL